MVFFNITILWSGWRMVTWNFHPILWLLIQELKIYRPCEKAHLVYYTTKKIGAVTFYFSNWADGVWTCRGYKIPNRLNFLAHEHKKRSGGRVQTSCPSLVPRVNPYCLRRSWNFRCRIRHEITLHCTALHCNDLSGIWDSAYEPNMSQEVETNGDLNQSWNIFLL